MFTVGYSAHFGEGNEVGYGARHEVGYGRTNCTMLCWLKP